MLGQMRKASRDITEKLELLRRQKGMQMVQTASKLT